MTGEAGPADSASAGVQSPNSSFRIHLQRCWARAIPALWRSASASPRGRRAASGGLPGLLTTSLLIRQCSQRTSLDSLRGSSAETLALSSEGISLSWGSNCWNSPCARAIARITARAHAKKRPTYDRCLRAPVDADQGRLGGAGADRGHDDLRDLLGVGDHGDVRRPSISVTVAPMRSLLKWCTPGVMHLSAVGSTAHTGRLRHAGVSAASVSATPASGHHDFSQLPRLSLAALS